MASGAFGLLGGVGEVGSIGGLSGGVGGVRHELRAGRECRCSRGRRV